MRPLPTGTVSFLFTDIEGSTRLLEELGARYVQALAEHRRIVREACARHGGVEVDTQGDAFFVAFADAREAAQAAAEAQAELASGPMRVRMGVHTGEPIVWAEGYAGVDVHRGARICAAAHGGQVVSLRADCRPARGRAAAPARRAPAQGLVCAAAAVPARPGRVFATPDSACHEPPGAAESADRPRTRAFGDNRPGERSHAAADADRRRWQREDAARTADRRRGRGGLPRGVFWVPLAAVSETELVLPTVAGTIGAKDGLPEHVEGKRMLLLLDNFEHVLGAAREVGELLQRCPNLKLLVTSRAVLRLSGEWAYQVEPLPETDAVSLFTERARAIVSKFEPR